MADAQNTTGEKGTMAIRLGDIAPDFTAETTEGTIRFHEFIGDGWVVLFSHPKDFTPVCTTELGYMARSQPEFDKRGVRLSGLNDTLKHAELLVKFCDGLRVEVNLIPYNPIRLVADNSVQLAQYNSSSLPGGEFTGHGFNSSCIADREAFAAILRSAGIRTSIRTSFGKESSAACGQLRANANG